MKAINAKYQKQVKKATKLLAKYNDLDNKRNEAEGLGDDKLLDKLDRQCERVFNQYLEAEEGLPQKEVTAINDYVYGEPCYSLWVGGVEVNDYYLTLGIALELKEEYRGYEDVYVRNENFTAIKY